MHKSLINSVLNSSQFLETSVQVPLPPVVTGGVYLHLNLYELVLYFSFKIIDSHSSGVIVFSAL